MDKYKSKSFIALAIRFTIIFFIVIVIIKSIGAFFSGGTAGLNELFLAEGKLKYFLTLYGLMAILYGLFMAGYYKFIKK